MNNELLTGQIIKAALRVHTVLGPGLLESAYRICLKYVLEEGGLQVHSELPIPIQFEGKIIATGFRLDLLVEDRVVVELKTVSKLAPVDHAQLLSYLRLSKKPTGLLINFHVARLRDGIKRVSN
jgi:GxxExxY protein